MQLARTRKEDFNFILTLYAMERLLYRLSRSTHESTFILKGAMVCLSSSVARPPDSLGYQCSEHAASDKATHVVLTKAAR
jgi:hypothetical protein